MGRYDGEDYEDAGWCAPGTHKRAINGICYRCRRRVPEPAVERSSLGTPSAKATRASVSDAAAAKVVGMADGMAAEQRRVLDLLDDPGLLEEMAHAHYRNQWPAVDDWDEGTDMWRDLHRDNMAAALDVLRARIEEDDDA